MPIRDLVDSYIQKGYGLRDAQNPRIREYVFPIIYLYKDIRTFH